MKEKLLGWLAVRKFKKHCYPGWENNHKLFVVAGKFAGNRLTPMVKADSGEWIAGHLDISGYAIVETKNVRRAD